jgi:hypothetical protein
VRWCRQLLTDRNEDFENGHAPVGIVASEEEPDPSADQS